MPHGPTRWSRNSTPASPRPFPADGDPAAELVRLQRVLDAAAQRNWRVAKVNLLVEHNVPVTLQNTPATVSAPAARRSLASAR